jgi:hypothetical protein
MRYTALILCVLSAVVFGEIHKVELDSAITLTGEIVEFDKSAHTYDSCDTGVGWNAICLINGKPWFGGDAGLDLPRNKMKSLELNLYGQNIKLDVSGMYNPSFGNKLKLRQFEIQKEEMGYYLFGHFSDGAGSYMCQWKIVKGGSIRLKISNDEQDLIWQKER